MSPALSHTTCHGGVRRSGVTPPCISESLLYAGKYFSQIHAPVALPLSKELAGTHRVLRRAGGWGG